MVSILQPKDTDWRTDLKKRPTFVVYRQCNSLAKTNTDLKWEDGKDSLS
jgi:hypothetical protein